MYLSNSYRLNLISYIFVKRSDSISHEKPKIKLGTIVYPNFQDKYIAISLDLSMRNNTLARPIYLTK